MVGGFQCFLLFFFSLFLQNQLGVQAQNLLKWFQVVHNSFYESVGSSSLRINTCETAAINLKSYVKYSYSTMMIYNVHLLRLVRYSIKCCSSKLLLFYGTRASLLSFCSCLPPRCSVTPLDRSPQRLRQWSYSLSLQNWDVQLDLLLDSSSPNQWMTNCTYRNTIFLSKHFLGLL